jgi:hypothetical protein
VGDELRHFLVGKAGADRQGLETLALVHQFLEAAPVLGFDFDDRRQAVDGLFQVAGA